MTPEQAEEGIAKAKAAGIEVLASIIFGIGGKERSKKHIVETTRLLNILKPEQLAPIALTVQPGTIFANQVETREFNQATPLQILEEEKFLLENMTFSTIYWGDHGNNIVSCKRQPSGIARTLSEKNYECNCQSSRYKTGNAPDIIMVDDGTITNFHKKGKSGN